MSFAYELELFLSISASPYKYEVEGFLFTLIFFYSSVIRRKYYSIFSKKTARRNSLKQILGHDNSKYSNNSLIFLKLRTS